MYTANQLRNTFINYFKTKNHKHIKSSSIIPTDDKSLLFVNSGMVQFKKIFTSEINDFSGFKDLKRAVSVQRCVRAGGKHNDLDDVGKDNYHHTYFEMLGNWSFGDYFKKEAIDFAYDFLVNVLKLKKENLYVTYYSPVRVNEIDNNDFKMIDKNENKNNIDDDFNNKPYTFTEDIETKNIWVKYFPENKILPFEKENFWEMGDTGPCGPCTEIHYDRIGNRDASHLVNKDDPDVIEIWNIVFMEYFRNKNGFSTLNRKCIDTGMGLERVLSILNDVRSNYLTESFIPIFDFMSKTYNLPKYCEPENENNNENENEPENNPEIVEKIAKLSLGSPKEEITIAYRIIADHCRTISVCLFDGVEFSSEGRGYVLRRITRRSIRYLHDIFNLRCGELSKICDFASKNLNLTLEERHLKMIDDEEKLFLKTLEKGKHYFNTITKNGNLTGRDLFILHDTYGFPADLSIILANERKIEVDLKDYELFKEQAKEKSRKKGNNDFKVDLSELEKYPHTDDKFKYTIHDENNCLKASVLCLIVKNKVIDIDYKNDIDYKKDMDYKNDIDYKKDIDDKEKIGIILDKTCFYAEKGGQVGDQGFIYFLENDNFNKNFVGKFKVENTKYIGNYVIHVGTYSGKILKTALLQIDSERRLKIQKNHTATHILNYVLKNLYDCDQNGSFLNHEKLRFDFVVKNEICKKENIDIKRIEDEVNQIINKNLRVTTEFKKFDEIENVIYLKNENYPPIVRIVSINYPENICDKEKVVSDLKTSNINTTNLKTTDLNTTDHQTPFFSELCGGTHVKNTSEIKLFRIISYSSISNTTKRIVGVTDEIALKCTENGQRMINECRNGKISKNSDISGDIPVVDRDEIAKLNRINENKNIEEWKNNLKKYKEKILALEDETIIFEVKKFSENILKDLNSIASVVPKNKKLLIYLIDNHDFYFLERNCCLSVGDLEVFGNVKAGGKEFLMGKIENICLMEELIRFIKNRVCI
ncbi:Alanine--tRNA ligase, cytoplasmic [Dictyocoela muelleri]|nr:Alanine--tRNA ligase, cytoplasmic [Dictyocoela muelleri]